MFYQLVVLCCLCVIWIMWSKKHSASEPPELSGKLPIIGHAHRFIGDGPKFYKTLQKISKEDFQKNGLITFSLGPRKLYAAADPEDCLTILNKCLEKAFVYDFVKPYFGDGLGTANVATWKKTRKLLNPAFNQTVLDGFVGVFNTQALRLVDQLAVEVGKPFDHDPFLRINILETVCTTALGVDLRNYNLHKHYLTRLTKVTKIIIERMQKFWLHSDFIFNMSQQKKTQDEQLEHILALSKSIIKEKKIERENKSKTKTKREKCKPFIDLILDLADGDDTGIFTDEHIRAEIDTIIGAGHDTASSLLTFTLTELGSRDDVQEKAYNEILQVLGHQTSINQEDLSRLVYIDAVLRETLRLYPIIPVLGRRSEEDVQLKNYTITANNEYFVSIHGLHRQNIWGPDADQFRPERWFDKETLPDPKYFGGFGIGRRSCIGKAYAMMSMKITLAHVLRNYRVSADVSKMVVTMDIVIRPESGHYITLSPRNT